MNRPSKVATIAAAAMFVTALPALASVSEHGSQSCSSSNSVVIQSRSRDTTRVYYPDGTLKRTYYNYPNWTTKYTHTGTNSTSWQVWATQANFFDPLDESNTYAYCANYG